MKFQSEHVATEDEISQAFSMIAFGYHMNLRLGNYGNLVLNHMEILLYLWESKVKQRMIGKLFRSIYQIYCKRLTYTLL
ncbi:Hypothetical predicted protein [Octopus vulgaris]|uniref:Uncharacterized protein n=1 Tax=Octopus vulgaris TaxID=6645 RepID=A0AA36AYT3_OCTVU|nr:Hypothetical predicted protein [Octopus vulgaris]